MAFPHLLPLSFFCNLSWIKTTTFWNTKINSRKSYTLRHNINFNLFTRTHLIIQSESRKSCLSGKNIKSSGQLLTLLICNISSDQNSSPKFIMPTHANRKFFYYICGYFILLWKINMLLLTWTSLHCVVHSSVPAKHHPLKLGCSKKNWKHYSTVEFQTLCQQDRNVTFTSYFCQTK